MCVACESRMSQICPHPILVRILFILSILSGCGCRLAAMHADDFTDVGTHYEAHSIQHEPITAIGQTLQQV